MKAQVLAGSRLLVATAAAQLSHMAENTVEPYHMIWLRTAATNVLVGTTVTRSKPGKALRQDHQQHFATEVTLAYAGWPPVLTEVTDPLAVALLGVTCSTVGP